MRDLLRIIPEYASLGSAQAWPEDPLEARTALGAGAQGPDSFNAVFGENQANFLGAPPILACSLRSVCHCRKLRRQGWAALPGSLPYTRAAIFILSGPPNTI